MIRVRREVVVFVRRRVRGGFVGDLEFRRVQIVVGKCAGLLIIIKPLNIEDLEMVGNLNKRLVPLLAPFAREK